MKWSQRGKKAIREILKQLFLFIISSQMVRQHCLCVLGGRETAKTFSLFPCGYQGSKAPPPHQGDKGKEQGKDGARLAYWQVGGAIQVPLGWRGVVLGKMGSGGAGGFLSPLHHVLRRSSQREAGDAACPLPTPRAVSGGDQLLPREQLPQIRPKQRAISIHHESFEGQVKVPSQAFHRRLSSPWLQLSPGTGVSPGGLRGWWQRQVWRSTSARAPAHQEVQGFTVGLGEQVTHCWKTPSPYPELLAVRGRREKRVNLLPSSAFRSDLLWQAWTPQWENSRKFEEFSLIRTAGQIAPLNSVPSAWHSRWVTGH